MTTYIHLFNFETKSEQKKAKDFSTIMPQAKLENFGIIGRKEHREWDESWKSLWIPEELFLSAWTYFSHQSLKNGMVSIEDGLEYFEMQKNDADFIQII